MKLIYCPICKSIKSLHYVKITRCLCKQSSGYYIDQVNAVLEGEAIPIGVDNLSFLQALELRPEHGQGSEFTAFVIPKQCHSVEHKEIDNV